MTTLNAKQIENAKAWIHDVFALAGFTMDFRESRYFGLSRITTTADKNHAINIYTEIINRKFNNIDSDLLALSDYAFGSTLADDVTLVKKPATSLAKYLAWFCAENKIYWNDTIVLPEEKTEFIGTMLGAALAETNCFATQKESSKTITPKIGGVSPKAATPAVHSTGSAKGLPKSGYKTSGAKSGEARDLKCSPGAKTKLFGNMYCITGKSSTAAAAAFAFIRPLLKSGADGTTNKVFIGRDSGYSDCACWFKDVEAADEFLMNCKTIMPSSVSDLHVAYKKADANGYFEIGTSFGNCWIKASRLNEEVTDTGSETDSEIITEGTDRVYTNEDLDAMIDIKYPSTDTINDIGSFDSFYKVYDR